MRQWISLCSLGLLLVDTGALAASRPRVRPVAPFQQIASEVLPPGDGYHPRMPALCVLPESEGLVAVWRATRLTLRGSETLGTWWRRFSSALEPLNDPVPVGPDEVLSKRDEGLPTCVAAADGKVLVAWESRFSALRDRGDLLGQLYALDGSPVGDQILLTEDRSADEFLADFARTADGNLLLTWNSYDALLQRDRVFLRRLDARGAPLGGDEPLAGTRAPDDPNRGYAQIAADGESVLAAWSEVVPVAGTTRASVAIFARPLGDEDAAPVLVSTEEAGIRHRCEGLAMNSSGGVVLWIASDESVRVRPIDTQAQPLGPEVTLDRVADGFIADRPVIAAAPDGSSYMAVWGVRDRDAEEVALWAQLLTPQAHPFGAPYRVDRLDTPRTINNKLRFPGVAYVSPDRVVVTWEYFWQPTGHFTDLEVHIQLLEIGNPNRECGDADDDGFVSASDALFVLNRAVGLGTCEACFCDVNASGSIFSSDALAVLRASVDSPAALQCPPCGP